MAESITKVVLVAGNHYGWDELAESFGFKADYFSALPIDVLAPSIRIEKRKGQAGNRVSERQRRKPWLYRKKHAKDTTACCRDSTVA
jgi:hypothetical protein